VPPRENTVWLYVHREEAERAQGLADDSEIAWEEHHRRARALHAAFDVDPDWRVADWGDTDATDRTREVVYLLLAFAAEQGADLAGDAALYIGEKLIVAGVDALAVGALGRLLGKVGRLLSKKDAKDAWLTLPTGQRIELVPDERVSEVQFRAVIEQRGEPKREVTFSMVDLDSAPADTPDPAAGA
jgi:hypothetical protein